MPSNILTAMRSPVIRSYLTYLAQSSQNPFGHRILLVRLYLLISHRTFFFPPQNRIWGYRKYHYFMFMIPYEQYQFFLLTIINLKKSKNLNGSYKFITILQNFKEIRNSKSENSFLVFCIKFVV